MAKRKRLTGMPVRKTLGLPAGVAIVLDHRGKLVATMTGLATPELVTRHCLMRLENSLVRDGLVKEGYVREFDTPTDIGEHPDG